MTSAVDLGEAGGLAYRSAGDASPRGTLAVIEGAGHFPFAETPERYRTVVARWLDEPAPTP